MARTGTEEGKTMGKRERERAVVKEKKKRRKNKGKRWKQKPAQRRSEIIQILFNGKTQIPLE